MLSFKYFRNIIRYISFSLFYLLFGQNIYQGNINFDYNGTVDGNFSSIIEDTLSTGISFNQIIEDTSFFLMASITQQNDNEFDLFLAVLRDTTHPLQPRVWDIPGEGDESNPLSLESIVLFMPGLDSSFVLQLFETFTDTSSNNDTTNILGDVFSELSNDLYLGLQGSIEVVTATDSSITGSFDVVMIKPAFYFPPHTVQIDNGEFFFSNTNFAELKSLKDEGINPKDFRLLPCYPNPFNPSTTIQYFSDEKTDFTLNIFDINGKKLENLQPENSSRIGLNKIQWYPKNYSSGIYFVVLETPSNIQSQKLILLK